MSDTIIGMFDRPEDANAARDQLVKSGIPISDIRLSPSAATTPGQVASAVEDKGFWESVKELFVGEDDDQHMSTYAEGTRRGGTLLTVQSPDSLTERTVQILQTNHAADLDQRATEWRKSGWMGGNTTQKTPKPVVASNIGMSMNTGRNTDAKVSDQAATIPIVKEELQIGKRVVNHGGVRLIRRVTETPIEKNVELSREKVKVGHRTVDRALQGSELNDAFTDKTIDLNETGEEAIVSKSARVVEEVVIGKETEKRTETVRDKVRQTEVHEERVPGDATTSDSKMSETQIKSGNVRSNQGS